MAILLSVIGLNVASPRPDLQEFTLDYISTKRLRENPSVVEHIQGRLLQGQILVSPNHKLHPQKFYKIGPSSWKLELEW